MTATKKEEPSKELNIHEAFIKASLTFRKPVFTKSVKYGSTSFEYAELSEIQDCVIIPLLNNGLYPIHDFYSEGGFHWIKTYLRYKNGETIGNVVFPIAIENKKMQEIGAQITYLKRYSLSIICNLSADSDNDGQEVVGQKIIKTITPAQIETIKKLLNGDENIGDMIKDKFKFKKVEAVSQDKFGTVVTFINLQNMQKGKSNVNSS